MEDKPDDMKRAPAAETPQGDDHARRRSQSAAAGREFLRAVGGDLTTLTHTARRHLRDRRRYLIAASPRWARASLRAMRPDGGAWASTTGKVLRRLVLRVGMVVGTIAIVGALAFGGGMVWALNDLKLSDAQTQPDRPSLLLEAANGTPLGRIGPLKSANKSLSDFPPVLIHAVLSIEDHRYYQHYGVDPVGILRAAHKNAEAGGIVEGGSTITQQYVKMSYVGDTRTYTRKLREAFASLWLETHLGKKEILRRYLNQIYLGAGAYGMAAAARIYFDEDLHDLTLPQAAMLAGLIQAPSQYNPLAHLDIAQTRAAAVLDAMVTYHAIDANAANDAKAHPAVPKLAPRLAPARSWFTAWVGTQAPAVIGHQAGTMRLRTTLMPDVQKAAQEILDAALQAQGRRLGVSQGALVAMRPDGAVLAMVGGRDYGASQFNRAVAPNRQPGSAFKLFVYLTALRAGYTPDDKIDGGRISIRRWHPENYGNEHYGRITLADAFAHSVNTAAVRLAMDVGLNKVIATARDLGIDTPLSPTPSLALGAYGVSLLDLTSAYAAVRANKMPVRPWGIAQVGAADKDAALRPAAPQQSSRTLGATQAPMMELLRGVVEHGTGRGAALDDGSAAGKTGTSQDYRDAWFIGFNDSLVVGVWLGNDDDKPMRHVTGGSLPASIWKAFMTQATPLVSQQGTQIAAAPAAETTGQGSQPSTPPGDDQADTGQEDSGLCDIQACSSTYHSFRASDCTYQPYTGGRRRLCPMARSVNADARPGGGTTGAGAGTTGVAANDAGAHRQCNIEACARTYSSFDPSDCTYQPYGSRQRRLCER